MKVSKLINHHSCNFEREWYQHKNATIHLFVLTLALKAQYTVCFRPLNRTHDQGKYFDPKAKINLERIIQDYVFVDSLQYASKQCWVFKANKSIVVSLSYKGE